MQTEIPRLRAFVYVEHAIWSCGAAHPATDARHRSRASRASWRKRSCGRAGRVNVTVALRLREHPPARPLMMVLGLPPSYVLILACLAVPSLVGVALAIWGLIPRRIAEGPHCRACGYNLSGSASARCSEGGGDLSRRRAVKQGKFQRRWGRAATGIVLAILFAPPAMVGGWSALHGDRWDSWLPIRAGLPVEQLIGLSALMNPMRSAGERAQFEFIPCDPNDFAVSGGDAAAFGMSAKMTRSFRQLAPVAFFSNCTYLMEPDEEGGGEGVE